MPDALIATTAPASKINLLGMTRAQLESCFSEIGEKKFRAHQVMKWIHHRGVRDFEEMTDLSQSLRTRLDKIAEITPPTIAEQHDFHKSIPDHYLFMHRHVIPELQELGATDRDIEMLFVDNPRRLFEA